MRLCENETTEVYQNYGEELSILLIDTALKVNELEKSEDYSWFNLTVQTDIEEGYIVTLYAHG
jgi:hypothetical protein